MDRFLPEHLGFRVTAPVGPGLMRCDLCLRSLTLTRPIGAIAVMCWDCSSAFRWWSEQFEALRSMGKPEPTAIPVELPGVLQVPDWVPVDYARWQ